MISLNIRKPCSRVLWVPGSVCCQQGRPEQKKIHQLLTVDEWQRVLQTEWESQGEWEKGWDRGVALFCRYHCSLYCFSIRHTVSWIILPTRFMTPIKWLLQGKLRVFNSLRSMSWRFFSSTCYFLPLPACLYIINQPFPSLTAVMFVTDYHDCVEPGPQSTLQYPPSHLPLPPSTHSRRIRTLSSMKRYHILDF